MNNKEICDKIKEFLTNEEYEELAYFIHKENLEYEEGNIYRDDKSIFSVRDLRSYDFCCLFWDYVELYDRAFSKKYPDNEKESTNHSLLKFIKLH